MKDLKIDEVRKRKPLVFCRLAKDSFLVLIPDKFQHYSSICFPFLLTDLYTQPSLLLVRGRLLKGLSLFRTCDCSTCYPLASVHPPVKGNQNLHQVPIRSITKPCLVQIFKRHHAILSFRNESQ